MCIPANHPASMMSQDAANRFVSDTEKANWNSKVGPVEQGGFCRRDRGKCAYTPDYPGESGTGGSRWKNAVVSGSGGAVGKGAYTETGGSMGDSASSMAGGAVGQNANEAGEAERLARMQQQSVDLQAAVGQ